MRFCRSACAQRPQRAALIRRFGFAAALDDLRGGKRRLPAVDPENRELMLSLGAFSENASRAANSRAYAAEATVLKRAGEIGEIAAIEFLRGRRGENFDRRIKTRRILRKAMTRGKLTAKDRAYLTDGRGERAYFFLWDRKRALT